MEWTKRLGMDDRFQERYLNEGFSGGEKKRNEILQMAMMEPDVAVLDETDSGLDIDALRTVAHGIAEVRSGASRRWASCSSRTTSASSTTSRPTSCTCCSTAASSRPAAPSSRAASRPRASRRSGTRSRPDRAAPRRRAHQGRLPDPRRARSNGKRLVYLDSAASSQKPHAVLDAMDEHYRSYYANIHRGVYTIAEESTAAYEAARAKVARLHRRRQRERGRLHARTSPRRSTSSRTRGARTNLARGRRHRRHRDGAPRQHRAVAHPRRRARRRAAVGPDRRRLPPRPAANSTALLDGAKLLRVHRDVERARHRQRRPRPRRRRPRGRRARAGRRRAGRAARRGRRAGVGRRLRRLHRPQDARPERHRRLLGAPASCSRRCRRSSAAAR